ncbi:MAG: transposase [Leeuwenhoekiella sp.]|nr:MAG: transposase [Leeuwenhoekiella sp.]
MKANVQIIRKHRGFTDDFKRQIVSDFESGTYSVTQLSKLHGVSCTSIYKWIYKFSNFNEKGFRVVEMKQSSSQKVKELEQKVKELEATVGRKQIMIDFLETMIELAKDELDIDIKKNYSTPPSQGSGKSPKK